MYKTFNDEIEYRSINKGTDKMAYHYFTALFYNICINLLMRKLKISKGDFFQYLSNQMARRYCLDEKVIIQIFVAI